MKRPTLKDFKKEVLKDKKAKEIYDSLEPEFELLRKIIDARKKAKVFKEDLAENLNIKQTTLSKLEKNGYRKLSIESLERVADALGYSFKVSLSPKKK